MRILISNDDGIKATGIRTLAARLAFEHEVYVIAPERERSAMGHALTLHRPLRVEEVKLDFNVARAWETTGTPGDCVKIGLSQILELKPDLIISGINHGPNLGTDILYSGTVSAAMEGAVLGYPSIAVSLAYEDDSYIDFTYPADFIAHFLPQVKEMHFPPKTILNLNFPAIPRAEVQGIEITKLGTRMYTDSYDKRLDPRGKTYYWLAGEIIKRKEDDGTDINAVRNNKVSITPINFDMTHNNVIPELQKALCECEFCFIN